MTPSTYSPSSNNAGSEKSNLDSVGSSNNVIDHHLADKAIASVNEQADRARAAAQRLNTATTEYVSNHPMRSMVMAAFFGAAFAMVLGSRVGRH
jgi:ElaB/YqjD/DUF883 family membrane-anchored ribosome-binding protein